ncbi:MULTISPECIES: lantibiotic dehydratase [unclassified Streptomyces]|uniref:lantibiotic dehydratase n=1 Tax=unclassified Streptomyces TaxID=2593676 RepID=UPI0019082DEB|nr:lantibiotic dehydratase [Streptomyces sp. HSG2]
MTDGVSPARTVDRVDFAPAHPLGDSDWRVWDVGLLRGAGFPVSGLGILGGPRAARSADRVGTDGTEAFHAAYRADSDAESRALADLAADGDFRRAVAWQNRTIYRVLDSVVEGRGSASRRRRRERGIAMYWLRYCAKADMIGFFGPGAWMTVGQGRRAVDVEHGPALTRERHTSFERWAVAALGDWMVAQPGARWWFPPMLRADVHLDGDRLVLAGGRTIRLRDDDARVLGLADGDRSADAIAQETGWDAASARERVEKALARLVRQRVVTWDANIPVDVRAEAVLRRRVAGVGDPTLLARFREVLAELDGLREAIDGSSTAEELAESLDRLDAYFHRTTGRAASREQGKMYAGRTLCYQDSLRDCRMDLGRDFIDGIARPLALVADAADWFGNRLAELVEAEVAGLVRAAAPRSAVGVVTLADVWPRVLNLFWGDHPTPVRVATAELARKWQETLGVDPAAELPTRMRFSVAEIQGRARVAFATGPVRSPHLALHSPDLQIAAPSVAAVNEGSYITVLGELHACLATLDPSSLAWTTDDPPLRDKVNSALGGGRLVPLLPVDWIRNSGRVVPAHVGTTDRLIGFTRAPFDDRARVDPAASITLRESEGTVTATTPDGRERDIAELLGVPISIIAADAFKIGLDRAHAPRVTLDDLVLFRETWRPRLADVGLPEKADAERDYLAVRDWRARASLPDRLFVKFQAETKPYLVDLTSPTLVRSFATTVRAALRQDPEATVVLSEPLPDPDDSWLADSHGERYVSELRLQISRKVSE